MKTKFKKALLIVLFTIAIISVVGSADVDVLNKPVIVNLQVDIEDENDMNNIISILDMVEEKKWLVTVYVTGDMAEKHPDFIRTINNRGHYIGIHGWEKGERLTDLDYDGQYALINRSLSTIRDIVDDPRLVVDFKSQNFSYNNDTRAILQKLGLKSITGSFSSSEPFCLCRYAKSLGKITFPYPISNDFVAVPISDIKVNSSDLLLDDSVFYNGITSSNNKGISNIVSEDIYLTQLKDAYLAHNITKDPLVINIHPSITGADPAKMSTLGAFIDFVADQGGIIKPTAPITVQSNYIANLHATGPSYAVPGETINVAVTYNSLLYCPTYYFRVYGRYPSETTWFFIPNWRLHDSHSEYVSNGYHTFNMKVDIPEPPAETDSTYTIKVVGRACAGLCWPSDNNYESSYEFDIKIYKAKIIKLEADENIEIGEGLDGSDVNNPIWQKQDEYTFKPLADIGGTPLKIKVALEGLNQGDYIPTVKYDWVIYGGPSTTLHKSGKFDGWNGIIDNIDVPKQVGQYNLGLIFNIYKDNKLIGGPQIMTHKLYVVYDKPKISSGDGPKEKWLYVATDFGKGAETPEQVAEFVVNKEYSNPFSWIYKNQGEDWENMIDITTGDKANCYIFAEVWVNLTKVLGLNVLKPTYDPGMSFVTSTKKAIDDNYDANAKNNTTGITDRWEFGSHSVGKFSGKYYDPTFGLSGYTDSEQNVDYKDTGNLISENGLSFRIYKSPRNSETIKVRSLVNQKTPNGWPISEYIPNQSGGSNNILKSDFQKIFQINGLAGAFFTGNISDSGFDTDSDGLFNYLAANFEINATETSYYEIDSVLNSENTIISSGSLNTGSGIQSSSPDTTIYLNKGIRQVTVFFDGKHIYDNNKNGNFTISAIITGENQSDLKLFNTSFYNYTQFQGLTLNETNISDFGFDGNGDGLYDQLTVQVDLNVRRDAFYQIEGFLSRAGKQIDHNSYRDNLTKGIHTIYLNFDGSKIRSFKVNGSYVFELFLSDENYNKMSLYNTSSYNYSDFQQPMAEFAGNYSDHGIDSDGDGKFNWLSTEVKLNIFVEGNYSIAGWLSRNGSELISAQNNSYLEIGNHSAILNFDGTELFKQRINGPYNLSYIALIDENGTKIDDRYNNYVTSAYNYADFQTPLAYFTNSFTDYGLDTNGDGLYENLIVNAGLNVNNAGYYRLTGGLSGKENSTYNYTYLNAGTQNILFYFDGKTIYENGINGSFNITHLTLYNVNGTSIDFLYENYTTSPYNYSQFQQGGRISGIVNNSGGIPLSYAYVHLTGPYDDVRLTDANGSYSFTKLDGGSYSLNINPSNPNLKSTSGSVSLLAGQAASLNFTLQSAGSIAGRITAANGTPITNAIVFLSGYETPRYSVNSTGYYVIGELSAGLQTINAYASGYGSFYIGKDGIYSGSGTSTPVDVTINRTVCIDFAQQMQFQYADLELNTSSISFSKISPVRGEPFNISATVFNKGDGNVSAVEVRFYSGNPSFGKVIGSNIISVPGNGSSKAVIIPSNISGYYPLESGLQNISVVADPANSIFELNESNNIANSSINILPNQPPVITGVSVSPAIGSWITPFTYFWNVTDPNGDNVRIIPQIYVNGRWQNASETTCITCINPTPFQYEYRFTSVDRGQTAAYRLYYIDEFINGSYYSGGINTGYYPSETGISAPEIDSVSFELGIVEGAGAGYGSSFYPWSSYMYTIVQAGDSISVGTDNTINRVGLYDFTDSKWYYYPLDRIYYAGINTNITTIFSSHIGHFVEVHLYNDSIARNFHLIKQTAEGGIVEGGYPGGGSFSSWYTSAHTIILPGDSIYAASDVPVDRLAVYSYYDGKWDYYNITTITPARSSSVTVIPTAESMDITPYLRNYENRMVRIKLLQGATERNFHLIKRTAEGDIVEGGAGDSHSGNSFYTYSADLYTVIQKGDSLFISSDTSFNAVRIFDHIRNSWEYIDLDREYVQGESAQINELLYNNLAGFVNHLVRIQLYNNVDQRNFHLVKKNQNGGIVEGGYASADSSFGSWASSMSTLFRYGDRILATANGDFNSLKVYDYSSNNWTNINLNNTYQNYSLVDITPYLSSFEDKFIQIQVYYDANQRSYHMIKTFENQELIRNPPVLTDERISPLSGSWRTNYTYTLNITSSAKTAVTLQTFTNDRWINRKTKNASIGSRILSWNSYFTCLDRSQVSKYRFYYNDGLNTGYYPDESGVTGASLDNTPCGTGLVEGAGSGSGSSFSLWSDYFYTIVQDGDNVFAASSDTVNRVGIYDYTDDTWYYYDLNATYLRGMKFNITSAFLEHLDRFIQIKLLFNDAARNFHIIKQTAYGDAIEDGDRNYGSFGLWYPSAHTFVNKGDIFYAAADVPVDSLSVYNYSDNNWYNYSISTIIPIRDDIVANSNTSDTVIPKAVAFNITPYLEKHTGRFIKLKISQYNVDRPFHLIKRNTNGGISESGGGDGYGESSFYKAYTDLYTAFLKGDNVYITSDSDFRYLKLYDYNNESWDTLYIGGTYTAGKVANISSYIPDKYRNKLLRIQVHNTIGQVNFHILKNIQSGGFVEGGYPAGSFGLTGTNAFTIIGNGERILIASDDYINSIQVYDHSTDEFQKIDLNNVYQKYSLVDITQHLSGFEDRLVELRVYYGTVQKNFHMMKTFREKNVTGQRAVFLNESVTPLSGSWKGNYSYGIDIRSDFTVNVTLQTFANNRWINTGTINESPGNKSLNWNSRFTCLDRNQTSRYRFYYDDGLNTGYYPAETGKAGVLLDNTPCGTGIAEGAGASYGSPFYSWSTSAFTAIQHGDTLFATASDTVNKVAIYDYSDNSWHYYLMNRTYLRGEKIDISSAFSLHVDKLVQIMLYFNDISRSFHLIKETNNGAIAEGGYTGYGNSFSQWSTVSSTIVLSGDMLYAAVDASVDRLAVYNYSNDTWDYHQISTIIPAGPLTTAENTVLPEGVLINISSYIQPYHNRFIRIKLQQGLTDRNFHLIKRTAGGGIIEGGNGESTYGSSFYPWAGYMYTPVQAGDALFAAADASFDTIRIYDYTKSVWNYINPGKTYGRGEVVEIPASILSNYTNNIIQLNLYSGLTQRNFHLLKKNANGGIVESGYPNADSSFGSWGADMFTLLRDNDRVLIIADDYIDRIKVYDYSIDKWNDIYLNNVYREYSLVDITPYLAGYENKFIQLQVYYGDLKKNMHIIKTSDKNQTPYTAPVLSGNVAYPLSGTWKTDYSFRLNVSAAGDVNVTLQVYSNGRWLNSRTLTTHGYSIALWNYSFSCLDSGFAKYRFYYSDPFVSGYFPSESGAPGPELAETSCGKGIEEGAGAGAGSAFYHMTDSSNPHMFTTVSSSDKVYITGNEPVNNIRIYDYTISTWFTYRLNSTYERGIPIEITSLFGNHINNFVQIKAYYDDSVRYFHMVKQASLGDFIEGGHSSSASSFNYMAAYSNTIVLKDDRVYVIPEYEINRVGIYNHTNSTWYYFAPNGNLSAPAYKLLDITPFISNFQNRFVQVKVMEDSTERQFHMIKQSAKDGIVEGAGVAGGSSFYPWYSSLYTALEKSNRLYISPEFAVNKVAIYDYTQSSWSNYNLNHTFARGEAVNITEQLSNHTNHLVQIMMYEGTTVRNLHMLKMTEQGGMVEGGYPDADSSFNSWAGDMYTLFRDGDRLLVAGTDYFDSAKIYNYNDGAWHDVYFDNVFPSYSLTDLTPYLLEFQNKFIQIRLYNGNSQINYHLIKTSNGIYSDITPDLTVEDIIIPRQIIAAGSKVSISAMIRNIGDSDASNFMVRFTDENGSEIGSDNLIYTLNASGKNTVSTTWNATAGVHTIYVAVDVLNALQESNESNNNASRTISVLPDLVIRENDITFSGIYRRSITIHENSGNDLTDYQINLSVNTHQLIYENKMRIDCGDFRFSYLDNGSQINIPYWLEGGCNTPQTKIWIKVPRIPANSEAVVYMYYGNQSAISNSSPTDTMERLVPDTNTSGLWQFNEGSGNAAWDSSNNSNTGILYNNPVWVDGISGKAMSFDGVDDYVLVGDPVPASLQIQNEITLEAWIYATQYPSNDIDLIVGSQYDTNIAGISIFLDGRTNPDGQTAPTGHINFQIGDGSWHVTNSNAQVPLNQWVHIAATRKANENAKIYYNGVLQPLASVAWTGSISYAGAQFAIGQQKTLGRFFNGVVDNVAIYNRSLNASEIRSHYERRKIASIEPLILTGNEELAGQVMINADVSNTGGINASNVSVTFYDGVSLIGSAFIDTVPTMKMNDMNSFDISTDIDHDGNSELVFGSYYAGMYIVDPSTKTTLWNYDPNGWGYADWCNALSINDVDNDGKPELIFSCGLQNRFYVYGFNNSYPLVQEFSAAVGDIYDGTSDITTGDIDNDGIVEIILPDASTNPDHMEVWGWNGTSYILEKTFAPDEADGIHAIAVEDVDGDRIPEIVFNEYTDYGVSLYIYGYNGTDYSQEWKSPDLGGYLQAIVIGDTDNDEVPEIWTGDRDHYGENSGAVFVYKYDTASGSYRLDWMSAPNENGFSRHMSPASIADWDNDGLNEIAIGSYRSTDETGHVWVYEYDPASGNYVLEINIKPPSNSDHTTSPIFGDYDNDGIVELMIGDYSGNVYIYTPGGTLEWSNGNYGSYAAGWSGDNTLITGMADPRTQKHYGSPTSATISWNANAGSHNISAVLDENNTIPELNESNNIAHRSISFENLSDLSISASDIQFQSDNPARGEFQQINLTIHNTGNVPASGARVKTYYIDGMEDNFNSGVANDWTGIDGNWSVEGGELSANGISSIDARAVSGKNWSDYTYEGRLRIIEGGGNPEAGILFRIKDAAAGTNTGHYYMIVNYAGSNQVYLYKVSNGVTTLAYTSYVIDNGIWYNFSLVLNGSSVKYYINNNPVITYNNLNDYLEGRIGVRAWNHAHFDDLKITATGIIKSSIIPAIKGGSSSTLNIKPDTGTDLSWLLEEGTPGIHAIIDPENLIPEENESNNAASRILNVSDNLAPVFSNSYVTPLSGIWKDDYTYHLSMIDDTRADTINITLQIYSNEQWLDTGSKVVNTFSQTNLTWNTSFTPVDIGAQIRYRFNYTEYASSGNYYSGIINKGYYPSENGSIGALISNESGLMGIVEGSGAGYGSAFYPWYNYLYTVVLPGDDIHIAASEAIDNIRIYDYSVDQWFTYTLPVLDAGVDVNITGLTMNHSGNFIQIKAYSGNSEKSLHMLKSTSSGGIVEGGYPGSGSSFTSWSTYVYTIIQNDSSVYVAADLPVNRIAVYDFVDEYWNYYNLSMVTGKGRLVDITEMLTPYTDRFIEIKVLQDSSERNFHMIKRSFNGGIVEGAEGGTGGSPFYPWYSTLYTTLLNSDKVFISAQDQFNSLRIYDYTTSEWTSISLDRKYSGSEVADISIYLENFTNRLIAVNVYHYDNIRNFHMLKQTQNGDFVEGGYPGDDSSFGAYGGEKYFLMRSGDRILVTPAEEINSLKVFNYSTSEWDLIELSNTYARHRTVDITSYLLGYKGKFVRLQLYNGQSQKNYHMLKLTEKRDREKTNVPQFSNIYTNPDHGTWKDDFIIGATINSTSPVNITLQILSNDLWRNIEEKRVAGTVNTLWDPEFSCLDNGPVKYRFYFKDTDTSGYYPSESGIDGIALNDTACGFGIVEGAGSGYGSSFSEWSTSLYTVIQEGDTIYAVTSDAINKVKVYDYTFDTYYEHTINTTNMRGTPVDLTEALLAHTGKFIRVEVYYNDIQRSFHMIKYTKEGGIVEGGYPGYGNSFTSWSSYIYTMIKNGDRLYAAADAPVNRIAVYDYVDEYWHYHNLSSITGRAQLAELTEALLPYSGRFVEIKVLQDDTERSFHFIKRGQDGSIEEGADGGSSGSPFYPWYSTLYTTITSNDIIYVSANDRFNKMMIYDYTDSSWHTVIPGSQFNKTDIVDITQYLKEYQNKLIGITIYQYDTLRNFHMIKQTQNGTGDTVEGGYPDSYSSFGTVGTDMNTIFRHGDRILVTPNYYFDTLKVYNYSEDLWYTINLSNVYPQYRTVDISNYISQFENGFIQLQVYYGNSQKNFHMVKMTERSSDHESLNITFNHEYVYPAVGSWEDEFRIGADVNSSEPVDVTLQILSNNMWVNAGTKRISGNTSLEWNYNFSCLISGEIKYRIYYKYLDKGGYYPAESGISGMNLYDSGCGSGIVEGAGSGYGSSFYEWSTSMYTVSQEGDNIFISANDAVNKVKVYDYFNDTTYDYNLNDTYLRGFPVNITEYINGHLLHFIRVEVYYNDIQRSFHMAKYTQSGGFVEGGYGGYGGSFTSWSTYSNTMIEKLDRVYISADGQYNRIGIYDFVDEYWHYYNLSNTTHKGELVEITSSFSNYQGKLVQIKALMDGTERNFHMIKRTSGAGIVEGAEGGTGGSPFYSWYSSLYTTVSQSDRIFVAADNQFNNIRVFDYTDSNWHTLTLDRRYNKTEIVEITDYLKEYQDRMININLYHYDAQRNFHLIKKTQNGEGDIVEGGYPNSDSSFGGYGPDLYTLFLKGNRILVTPNGYIDTIKVYDYTDDTWRVLNMGNVYPGFTTMDITPFLSGFENRFIRLQLYYGNVLQNYHMVKTMSLKYSVQPVTELNAKAGLTWINWSWINPSSSRFSHVLIYLDGGFIMNTTSGQNSYNTTDLLPGTEHIFGTLTVDVNGINSSIWNNKTSQTLSFIDITPPNVSNPSVNQSDIPDDTDKIPLWGETAQLNVTVIDANGIASVTVNLSEIGGPAVKLMTNIGGNVYSTTTNASAGTVPKLYNLTVNATDTFGNSNNSVKIVLRVRKNGDTNGNNAVNIGDALRLANNVSYPGNPAYALISIYASDVNGNGALNIGDALRLANNVSYPGNPGYILK